MNMSTLDGDGDGRSTGRAEVNEIEEEESLSPDQRIKKLSPTFQMHGEGLMSQEEMSPITIIRARTEEFIDKNEVLNTNAFNATNYQKDADVFVESFWYWRSFSMYVFALLIMLSILTIMTYFWESSDVYAALMGTASSMIEATLGVP